MYAAWTRLKSHLNCSPPDCPHPSAHQPGPASPPTNSSGRALELNLVAPPTQILYYDGSFNDSRVNVALATTAAAAGAVVANYLECKQLFKVRGQATCGRGSSCFCAAAAATLLLLPTAVTCL